ncbi:MAG TPA: AraC family transcriptional regulator [Phnomibacter sp.]|nr:AraC family transcriptional regulator [Phnomibacter sp.]
MFQFVLQQGTSPELKHFAQIIEFGLQKISTINLDSFAGTISSGLRIYYIIEGRYEWMINDEYHTLYPCDVAVILPGQVLQSPKGYLEIGSLYWIALDLNEKEGDNGAEGLNKRKWKSADLHEFLTIKRMLYLNHAAVLQRLPEVGEMFVQVRNELINQEMGFQTRCSNLLIDLLIVLTRKLSHQHVSQRDFPGAFFKLEEALRKDLSHPWTLEEMAAMAGLGTTAFSEKVKSFTGFSPINYLINIRISEAIKLLKKPDINVTDIALDTGFYSSQHFSTTFKKLTGYTPSEFRKLHTSK